MRSKAFGIVFLFSLVAAVIVYTMLDRDGSTAAKGLAELRQGIEDLAKRMEDSVPHVYDKTRNYYDEENETYHFVGHVYDPEGNPVPDAIVYHLSLAYGFHETARTDATGFFDLPRKNTGYGTSGFGAIAPGLADIQLFGPRSSGAIGARIRLTLKPAGKISGRVFDRDGDPIANVSITTKATRLYDTTTNAEGDYLIEDVLLTGPFGFHVKAVGYGLASSTGENLRRGWEETLDPTRTYKAPDIVLESAEKVISGRAVDVDENSLQNVQLLLYSMRLGREKVYSDLRGEFLFPHVFNEEYRVYARLIDKSSQFVTAEGNIEVVGGDTNIVITLSPTYYVLPTNDAFR